MIYFGLLLVFIFEYMRPGSYVPALGILNSILPLGMFVVSLLVSGKTTNGEILWERNTLWLLFFLSLIGISVVVTAEVRFYAYTRFLQVLGYVLLFFMIVKLTIDLRRLKLLFATLVFIHVGLVLLNPDLILKLETRSYLQGVTFLGDGNDFALSVVIVVPMCLFLLLESKAKWQQLLYLAMLTILLLSIVGTSSRGAAIAISAVLLYQWSQSKKKLLGVAALAVVVGAVLALAPPSYFERMETVKDYETESSAQGRLDAWAASVRMAKDHPLLGVGSGHFGMMYSNQYRPPDYDSDTMKWLTAHSIYFLTLGELGLPGVVFLFAIILGNLRANGRRMREVDRLPNEAREAQRRLLVCLNSSMIAFAVGGAFLSAIYYPHIYVIAGIMTVGGLLHRELLEQASSSGAGAIESEAARELPRVI
jgi:putative inorganic carbon (HCO3(-)) transporter